MTDMVNSSATPHWIVLLVILPLLGAFLLPVLQRGSEQLARFAGPVVLLVSLGIGLQAWSALSQPAMIALGGFAPPLGIVFYVDQMAILFCLLILAMALLLWPYTSAISAREFNLTLLLTGAGCGLALWVSTTQPINLPGQLPGAMLQ